MYHNSIKTIAFSLGVLVVTAPLALAGGQKAGQSAGASSSSSAQQSQQQSGSQSGQSATPLMGAQSTTLIFATVEEVNKQQETVTLRGTEGNTIEMEVPQKTLSELQSGDVVEVAINRVSAVSIQKVPQGQQSGQQFGQQSGQQSAQMSGSSAQASDTISAKVQDVNKQEGTVTLQTAKGNTVELQVPQTMLSNLQDGDSVQVSIRKSQHGKQQDGKQQGASGKQQ